MSQWVGYYIQRTRSEMRFTSFDLNTEENTFSAAGNDRCGNFTFTGIIKEKNILAKKQYPTHIIYYSGECHDSNREIYGYWGFYETENQEPFWFGELSEADVQRFKNGLRRPDEWYN